MTSIKLKEIELTSINRKAEKVNQLKAQIEQLELKKTEAEADLRDSVNIAFELREIPIPDGSHIELKEDTLILNVPLVEDTKE